jgi:hypothetical protein
VSSPTLNELNTVPVGFGKYKDKSPVEILECDPAYLVWAIKTTGRIQCSEAVALAAFDAVKQCMSFSYGDDEGPLFPGR